LVYKKSVLLGAFFLCVAVVAVFVCSGYQMGTPRNMGPGLFPMALGLLLAFLSVILIVRGVLAGDEAVPTFALRPTVFVLGGGLLFALLLRPAGMIVAIIAAVIVSSFASKQLGLLPRSLLAVGLAIGCAVIFVGFLGQAIPLVGPLTRGLAPWI
jgi:hypothetical protein